MLFTKVVEVFHKVKSMRTTNALAQRCNSLITD